MDFSDFFQKRERLFLDISGRFPEFLKRIEMALSGTILPSISTFANQKEKCWEDVSCTVYDSTCFGHRMVFDLIT